MSFFFIHYIYIYIFQTVNLLISLKFIGSKGLQPDVLALNYARLIAYDIYIRMPKNSNNFKISSKTLIEFRFPHQATDPKHTMFDFRKVTGLYPTLDATDK